jgi:hypothetical protein
MENLGDDFDNVMSEYSDPFSVFKESPLRRRSEMIAMAHTCEGYFESSLTHPFNLAILKRFDEVKYLRSYRFDLAITNNVDFCDIALTRAWDIPIHIWTTTGPILDINSWAIGELFSKASNFKIKEFHRKRLTSQFHGKINPDLL